MNKLLFALILTIFFVQTAYCQTGTLKNKKDIVAICDKFMQTFKEGKFSDALQMLKKYSVIPPDQIDTSINATEKKFKKADNLLGKILSCDFVDEKSTRNYLERFYALKFENSVLVFKFSFYKSDGEWKIVKFEYK